MIQPRHLLLATVVAGAIVAGPVSATGAQLPLPTTSTTVAEEPTTTEPQSSSTTAAPAAPSTTEAAVAAEPGTSSAPEREGREVTATPAQDEEDGDGEVEEIVEEPTSTTVVSPLLEEGPPIDPDAAALAGQVGATTTSTTEPSEGDKDTTGRTVTLVVTALVALALVFGAVTFWYWRRTRPVEPAASRAT